MWFLFSQTRGLNKRAHTDVLVNNVTVLNSYNWDLDVDKVTVSPAVVLRLCAGDLVRVSTDVGTWTGNMAGDPSVMVTWFGITLLYAED